MCILKVIEIEGEESLMHIAQKHVVNTASKARSCRSEPRASEVTGERKVDPMKHFAGTVGCISKKMTWLAAHLKCLYANAYNMDNKHEELEAILLQESYGILSVTET